MCSFFLWVYVQMLHFPFTYFQANIMLIVSSSVAPYETSSNGRAELKRTLSLISFKCNSNFHRLHYRTLSNLIYWWLQFWLHSRYNLRPYFGNDPSTIRISTSLSISQGIPGEQSLCDDIILKALRRMNKMNDSFSSI